MNEEQKTRIEEDTERLVRMSQMFQELERDIYANAERWKEGNMKDHAFQHSIFLSIDEFIKHHKSRLQEYLKTIKD